MSWFSHALHKVGKFVEKLLTSPQFDQIEQILIEAAITPAASIVVKSLIVPSLVTDGFINQKEASAIDILWDDIVIVLKGDGNPGDMVKAAIKDRLDTPSTTQQFIQRLTASGLPQNEAAAVAAGIISKLDNLLV